MNSVLFEQVVEMLEREGINYEREFDNASNRDFIDILDDDAIQISDRDEEIEYYNNDRGVNQMFDTVYGVMEQLKEDLA